MALKQLRNPDLKIVYKGGWCLDAVRRAYGIAVKYPTATADWKSGKQYKQAPPEGVAVPVYFHLGNEPAGHVAISLPNGAVASSTLPGTHTGLYIHPTLSNLINMYSAANGGCTYLGWSDEVNDVKVVQEEIGEPEMNVWPDKITPLAGKMYTPIPMYNIQTGKSLGIMSGLDMLLTHKFYREEDGKTYYIPVDRADKKEPFGFIEGDMYRNGEFKEIPGPPGVDLTPQQRKDMENGKDFRELVNNL